MESNDRLIAPAPSDSVPPPEAEVRNRQLNEKIRRELEGLVILKPLTRWNEAYKEFPRFVLEYLVVSCFRRNGKDGPLE
jgi:predicted ATP-dependent Lon-type protease